MSNYYEILGIPKNSPESEIVHAAERLNADLEAQLTLDSEDVPVLLAAQKDILGMVEVLTDPEKRRIYDGGLNILQDINEVIEAVEEAEMEEVDEKKDRGAAQLQFELQPATASDFLPKYYTYGGSDRKEESGFKEDFSPAIYVCRTRPNASGIDFVSLSSRSESSEIKTIYDFRKEKEKVEVYVDGIKRAEVKEGECCVHYTEDTVEPDVPYTATTTVIDFNGSKIKTTRQFAAGAEMIAVYRNEKRLCNASSSNR